MANIGPIEGLQLHFTETEYTSLTHTRLQEHFWNRQVQTRTSTSR